MVQRHQRPVLCIVLLVAALPAVAAFAGIQRPRSQQSPSSISAWGVSLTRSSLPNTSSSTTTKLYAENAKQSPKIIIAGAPASGKGTQCERIQDTYGVVHLSTGDMLRAAVAAGTKVGKEAQSYMDSGKLVPDSTIIGVVRTTM